MLTSRRKLNHAQFRRILNNGFKRIIRLIEKYIQTQDN